MDLLSPKSQFLAAGHELAEASNHVLSSIQMSVVRFASSGTICSLNRRLEDNSSIRDVKYE
jgi:hypothetical protein